MGTPVRVIPVLDLMGGCVVRGIAGRRDEYRPIESRLVASSDPVSVAAALRDRFGLHEFYVADLDAIREDRIQWTALRGLASIGCRLMVDAGLRSTGRAAELCEAGVHRAVAAQETLPGPAVLREIIGAIGPERTVFSLDLKARQLLGPARTWRSRETLDRAVEAAECGAKAIIVLDLAGVGIAGGVPTVPLCRQIRRDLPGIELITGGGVRGRDDLLRLRDAEIDGVLVATALHDGSLTVEDVSHATA